jgi:hypothetical protein
VSERTADAVVAALSTDAATIAERHVALKLERHPIVDRRAPGISRQGLLEPVHPLAAARFAVVGEHLQRRGSRRPLRDCAGQQLG